MSAPYLVVLDELPRYWLKASYFTSVYFHLDIDGL
jgi:hypothetical protein